MSGHLVCPKDVAHPYTNTMPYLALTQMRQHLYKSRRRDFAPCKGEIPRVQIEDLCEGCISLSNAEGLNSVRINYRNHSLIYCKYPPSLKVLVDTRGST